MHPHPEQSVVKAVLWDMDGTLVDTEPYWIAAESELVASYGGTWSHAQAMQLVGQALTFSAGVLQDAGVRLSRREIIDTLSAEVIRRIRVEVPWRPGARELLDELHSAGVRCALVTMSEGPLAREVAASLPKPYFEFLITGDIVSRGKPHPEAYLTAIDRLRESDGGELDANQCVALEDSVPGVAAAMASGVITVGIPHQTPLPDDHRRTTWSTLSGRTLADLERLVIERSPAAAAAASGERLVEGAP